MKIISGKWRGTKLQTSASNHIYRPTMSHVRKSLFNILMHNHSIMQDESRSFLDLCAGHGGCGFEALSTCFDFACFVDNSTQAIDLIHTNARKLNIKQNSTPTSFATYQCDLTQTFPTMTQKFNIIYLDPPYNTAENFIYIVGKSIIESDALKENGMFICEMPSKISIPSPEHFNIIRTKKYGDTLLAFYSRASSQ